MINHTERRAAGLALIAGAVLLAAFVIIAAWLLPPLGDKTGFADWVISPYWRHLTGLALVGVILLQFGLMAVYARIRAQAGLAGLIGFVAVELALLMMASVISWEAFLYPVIGAHADTTYLIADRIIYDDPAMRMFRIGQLAALAMGLLLFNFAIFRSKTFGRAAPLLMLAGAGASTLGPISVTIEYAGIAMLALGCAMLGVHLLRSDGAESIPVTVGTTP